MAIALVQRATANGRPSPGQNTFTAAFTGPVRSASLLVAVVALPVGFTTSLQDSNGANWLQAGSYANGSGCVLGLFYLPNATSGPLSVTLTNSAANGICGVLLLEYQGADTTAPLHATVSATGNAPGPTTGVVTAAAGELCFACYAQFQAALTSHAIGGGYQIEAQLLGGSFLGSMGAADHRTSGNEGATWSLPQAVPWAAIGASFKPATVLAQQYVPEIHTGPQLLGAPWRTTQPVPPVKQPAMPAPPQYVPPISAGPPLLGAPWNRLQPAEVLSSKDVRRQLATPHVPEIETGPPIFGAPWNVRLPSVPPCPSPATPPATPTIGIPEIREGPPLFGAPWLNPSPVSPPPAPPAPSPPAPTIPGGLPLFARDPEQDPRTRRFTEMVGSLLNSLKSQGCIRQDRGGNWQVVPTRFVADRPPGPDDDETTGVQIGTTWLVRTTEDVYICVSADEGSARWKGPLLAGTPQVSSVFGRMGAVIAQTGDYAVGQITGAAPIDSPVFTGDAEYINSLPLADVSNHLATTGFVHDAVTAGGISIGEPVLSGAPHCLLFVGNLAFPHSLLTQDTAFTYNGTTLTAPALSLTVSPLGIGSGGTGLAPTLANNGQLLVGNGAGFTLATLTAGTNVTVTNGSGTITIAASGSMAIGGTVTSGTAGSVLFVDGAGDLGQDNSHLFWDATNARLCLGRTSGSGVLNIDHPDWWQEWFLSGTFAGFVGRSGRWEGTGDNNVSIAATTAFMKMYAGSSATPSLSLGPGVTYMNEWLVGVAGGTIYGIAAKSGTFFGDSDANFMIASNTGAFYFGTAGGATALLSLSNNGIVGINTGTNSPVAQLEIDTYTAAEPGLAVAGVASQTGVMVQIQGTTSTTANRPQADFDTSWATSTDATRKARFYIRIWDTSAREAFRAESDGTQALISFYGVSAVARQTAAADATDLATVITLSNNLKSILKNVGIAQ